MNIRKIALIVCVGAQALAARGGVLTNALELYFSFDSEFINETYVVDQWTGEGGLHDGVDTVWNANPLLTLSGLKGFGNALNISNPLTRPHQNNPIESVRAFLPGTNNYTATFWYRQSAPTARTAIFGAGASADDIYHSQGLLLSVATNGYVVVTYQQESDVTGGREFFYGPGAVLDGVTWNHVVLVRAGTDLRLWINGSPAGSASLPADYNLTVSAMEWTRELYLGDYGPWPYVPVAVPHSAMDDLAVFHRALTESEIAQIWNNGTGATLASLLLTNGPGDLDLIGADDFSSYPDGAIAGSIGGTGFDFNNSTIGLQGHTALASQWVSAWGKPVVLDDRLTTQNSGARRAYHGLETNGAVGPSAATQVLYLRADMLPASNSGWSQLYSFENNSPHVVFGLSNNSPSGQPEFMIQEIGKAAVFNTNSPFHPPNGQWQTLVAKVDFLEKLFSLWVNPDLSQPEALNVPELSSRFSSSNSSTALGIGSSLSTSWDNVIAARNWSALSRLPTLPRSYSAWMTSYSGAASGASFCQDPDADGIPNGLEYVFGSDPSRSNQCLFNVSAVPGTLRFHHLLQKNLPPDVTCSYEWSTNLIDWVPDGASLGGTTVKTARRMVSERSLTSEVEVTASVTGVSTPTLFLRLKVVRNEVFQFHGIRPTDQGGTNGLANPDRGFRLEIVAGETQRGSKYYPYGVITMLPRDVETSLTGNESNDELWLKVFQYYRSQGITMALAYIYLTDFSDGSNLSPFKLAAINTSFAYARSNGFKLTPQFLYEYTSPPPLGPTAATILKHLDQLSNCFQLNAAVMPWLRAGFIGAYGEWHHPYNDLLSDRSIPASIIAKQFQILPDDKMILMRVPKYKRWVLGEEELSAYTLLSPAEAYSGTARSRLGHCNDGFLAGNNDGFTWPEAPLYSSTGNPEFDMATVESAYTPTEGEMFVQDFAGRVDGIQAILRLRLHHYCALSYFHSNNELERYGGMNFPPYSLNYWQQTPITMSQLQAHRLPISDGYFSDESGADVQRTQYEYIRDHLGYRLELQEVWMPTVATRGKPLEFSFTLINRGFATLHNPRPVFLTLIDSQDRVTALQLQDVNPQKWQPHTPGDPLYTPLAHKSTSRVTVPQHLPPGSYRLGLWLPDLNESIRLNPGYAVRLANRDTTWWVSTSNQYGINVFCPITLQ